jgi:SAM-dependent methyltransferase
MSMASGQTQPFLSFLGRWHGLLVHQRRVRVLAGLLGSWIPASSRVLDIGCGDGAIGRLIAEGHPGVSVQGVEFSARSGCRIPCSAFDGSTLPFTADSFDVCMLTDVLHHTTDLRALLREAARASRRYVLIKDHARENALDGITLRVMDWVGNRPHGVQLTYGYQSRAQWQEHFAACGLREVDFTSCVPLYTVPFSWVFGRKLHFVSLLEKIAPPA